MHNSRRERVNEGLIPSSKGHRAEWKQLLTAGSRLHRELLAASMKGGNQRRMVCGEGNKQSRKEGTYKSILRQDPKEGRNHNRQEWRKGEFRLELQTGGVGAATCESLTTLCEHQGLKLSGTV